MAALLLTPVEASTTDDEVRNFLMKYGFPSFDRIERVPSEGNRPGALVTFDAYSSAALRTLLPRVHQVFWKNHTVAVLVMRDPIE